MASIEIPGFEILEKIGAGGMATVWKARQISLDRTVAIKILYSKFPSDPADIGRFQKEVHSIARLKHPGIVQVYDANAVGDACYLVMEYIAGYTVGDWLKRKGALPVKDALLVTECVADALGYAWKESGIIHCDIKPDNVLIDADGTVKVSDLGLARILGAMLHDEQSDEVIGSPAYIAPEQVLGEVMLDFRADMYALGAMLYHMVSGQVPFAGQPEKAVMDLQVSGTISDPIDLNNEVPAAVCWLIEKMMCKDPEGRHSTWTDFIKDLLRAKKGLRPLGEPLPAGVSTVGRSSVRLDGRAVPPATLAQNAIRRKEADKAEFRIRKALEQADYDDARDALRKACEHDHTRQERLNLEFGFIDNSDQNDATALRKQNWRRLAWRALSALNPEPIVRTSVDADLTLKESAPQIDLHVTTVEGDDTPEVKGERLEEATLKLFRRFFSIADDDCAAILSKLRQQDRGTQFGYDIGFDCVVKHDTTVRCRVECKNLAGPITPKDVADKIAILEATSKDIDHWILISPHADPSNSLNNLLEYWERDGKYDFSIQIWTPSTGVAEFFGLVPSVYEQFFADSDMGVHPSEWSAPRRSEIAEKWREKLRPPLRVSKSWARYLRSPRTLCMQREDAEELDSLYQNHVSLNCINTSVPLIERPLTDVINEWLTSGAGQFLFLLGDFGDGKTAFTYTYARQKCKEFLQKRHDGWIPIRFPLKDYWQCGESRQFLRRRLEEFGTDVEEFLVLKGSHRVLVMLDGFDEMSKRLDAESVTTNIKALLQCCEEFDGAKVLITSRTHFFENRQDKERLLDRLGNPPLVRIRPISRAATSRHLVEFAEGRASQEIVSRLHRISDPIGLAQKPLFLNMVKDTILELPEDPDEVSLYTVYTRKCLRRKIENLEDDALSIARDKVVDRMEEILEDVAVALQQTQSEYVSLVAFAQTRDRSFVKLLWDTTGSQSDEQDATARVGLRSLLVRVETAQPTAGWCVDFCHRSMKEYFVGRRLYRELLKGRVNAESFLHATPVNHEILGFAGGLMIRDKDAKWSDILYELVKSSDVPLSRNKWRRRLLGLLGKSLAHNDTKSNLGGHAVTLLYRIAGGLPGRDWSGLHLDYADLTGADLSGKDFRRSSLRYSCLDNANLERVDFRDADLSGVRLEETEVVEALTIAQDEIIVSYGDSTLRKWKTSGTDKFECQTVFKGAASKVDRLGISQDIGMWAHLGSDLAFFDINGDGTLSLQARFPVRPSCHDLFIAPQMIFYSKDSGREGRSVVWLDGSMNCRAVALGRVKPAIVTPMSADLVALYDVSDGLAILTGKGKVKRIVEAGSARITSIASYTLRDKGSYRLACGIDTGFVKAWDVAVSENDMSFALILDHQLHEGSVTAVEFMDEHRIVSGGCDRCVLITRVGHSESVLNGEIERKLHLSVRCTGMKTSGMVGLQERSRLNELIKKDAGLLQANSKLS